MYYGLPTPPDEPGRFSADLVVWLGLDQKLERLQGGWPQCMAYRWTLGFLMVFESNFGNELYNTPQDIIDQVVAHLGMGEPKWYLSCIDYLC